MSLFMSSARYTHVTLIFNISHVHNTLVKGGKNTRSFTWYFVNCTLNDENSLGGSYKVTIPLLSITCHNSIIFKVHTQNSHNGFQSRVRSNNPSFFRFSHSLQPLLTLYHVPSFLMLNMSVIYQTCWINQKGLSKFSFFFG